MQRIAKLVFWLSVLTTVCCGCRLNLKWRTVVVKPANVVESVPADKSPSRGRVTSELRYVIQTERGRRTSIVAPGLASLQLQISQYCMKAWKVKGPEACAALIEDLKGILAHNRDNHGFTIGGLTIVPASYFLRQK